MDINKKSAAVAAGITLRKLRELRGHSVAEFSKLSNLTETTIYKIEAGNWNFTIFFFFKYVQILEFNILFEDKHSDSEISEALRNTTDRINYSDLI